MPKQSEVTYETPSQPRQLRLDTTTSCNAVCLSCHRYSSERKGEMPAALIGELLYDVARWEKPLDEIVPVNYGEFMLRSDWLEILHWIANKLPRTQIVLPTNGLLIAGNEKDLVSIPTLTTINFSINAYYDETYEQFTRLPAETLRSIEKSIAILRAYRPSLMVRASMVHDPMYQTDFERDQFRAFWHGKATDVAVIPAASCNRPDKQPLIRTRLPCRSIFSDIVVGYDGKLTSCCFEPGFQMSLGYYSGDLKKDWMNKDLEGMRTAHNKHKRDMMPTCAGCTFA